MILIVGGGPAGLAAAIACGKKGILLERNPEAGKKLLISGSGQCNLSNARSHEEFLAALGDFRTWLKPAFYNYDNQALMDLLAENGCGVWIREDGKVFPQSRKANDVLSTLLTVLHKRGGTLRTGFMVQSIVKAAGGFLVTLADGKRLEAEKVIVAAGGAAWKHTGSDGASYRLAESMGHSIVKPRPALSGVQIEGWDAFHQCAGVSLRAGLRIGKQMFKGDLLFTHKGFSGPVILDNSWRMEPKTAIRISFVDCTDFIRSLAENPKKRVISLVWGMALPHSVAEAAFRHLGISSDVTAAELRASERNRLINWLESAEFRIQSLESLDSAMSDYGGVSLKEVNSKTMESRMIPGLYFAGESLAYSLPSGGFSIQMAFSTGYLAGISAVNSI
ncbi:MAG: aminoacetone oxidase family FAD-binding enzyme [Candidatus Cloacimonadaceae bacterium]|jgi:predicted Rossmann fold flavoprotein|nr:aminoacetone oxidase family FAD-binding enzyme [Candidatus Cloacimonadaceae bacterium]